MTRRASVSSSPASSGPISSKSKSCRRNSSLRIGCCRSRLPHRQQPHLLIDRPHHRPHLRQLQREPKRASQTARPRHHQSVERSETIGQRSRQQTPERCHSEKRRRIVAHHAYAFVFRRQRLNNRVADGRPLHHPEPDHQQQRKRNPKRVRKAQQHQPHAQQRGGNLQHPRQAHHGLSQSERKTGGQRANPRRRCEPSQRSRSAMQYLRRDERQQDRIRKSHERHQRKQQQDRAHRTKRTDIVPPFAQTFPHPGRGTRRLLRRDPHRQQRRNHRYIAQPVDQKTHALADD